MHSILNGPGYCEIPYTFNVRTIEDLQLKAVNRFCDMASSRIQNSPTVKCGKPRNVFLGGVLSFLGFTFLVLVCMSTIRGEAQGNVLIGFLVPLVFILIGLAMLAERDGGDFDIGSKTWLRQSGFVPLARSWKGTFADLARVELQTELRYTGGRMGSKAEYWVTKIIFTDTAIPPVIVYFLLIPVALIDSQTVADLGGKLADRLGLKFSTTDRP